MLAEFGHSLQSAFAPQVLTILAALGILILGWIVAVIIRAAIRKGLGALKVDRRVSDSVGQQISIEKPVALIFFWLIILMTIVGIFDALHLGNVSAPLASMVSQFTAYLPRLLAAAVLLGVAWLIATLVRAVVSRALRATTLDDKLIAQAGMSPMSENIGKALFWLVFLLFIPAIVGALDIRGLSVPFEGMITEFVDMIPDIAAAAAIGFVGWIIARILRSLTSGALGAMGADSGGAKLGLKGAKPISQTVGATVFGLVLLFTVVAALDALGVRSIAEPAQAMLARILGAVPHVVVALLILVAGFIIGRLVGGIVTTLAATAGIDGWPQRLGFTGQGAADAHPSRLLGTIVLAYVLLFAAIEAANHLGMDRLADLLVSFVRFSGDILLGLVVLAVGFWIARLVGGAIQQTSDRHGLLLSRIARFAIIGLVIAMGLRAMGIADDVVNLGFGLVLGAVAVAFALAFGLGGREAAARLLQRWTRRFED